MIRKFVLGLIIILAFFLCLWNISLHPVGFTQDEASLGYDAYSLLKTGHDQWGVSWPLLFRSLGDFKLPLYGYLTIPSVAVFGLNEFSTRFPSALFGTLAVLATYLMVKKLFSEHKENELIALMSALLLAISPWNISLSRVGLGVNLSTFFIPLGIWAFLKGLEKPKWMILASLSFGLNLFSYHGARLFTPVIIFLLSIFFYRKFSLKRQWLSILVFLFFFVAAFSTFFFGAGKRGSDILITNPTDKWAAVSTRRYEAVLLGLPDSVARVFSNKPAYVEHLFLQNYFSYLSPYFLFFQGAGEWSYGMIPGRGVMYFFEIIFIVLALVALIRKKDSLLLGFLFLWIVLSPFAAAMTKGPGYAANRAVVMLPAIEIFSAYGFFIFYSFVKEKLRGAWRIATFSILGIVIFGSLLVFTEDYLYHTPYGSAESMQYGEKEAFIYVNKIAGNYEMIYVGRGLGASNIWVQFYEKWDPHEVQLASKTWLRYEQEGFLYLDGLEGYWLGKYRFGSLYYDNNKDKPGILFIGKPEEFPGKVIALHTVYYPDGKPAILIVDPSSQVLTAK
ncbi:glycosyltransferase family 39 protein [Patescibacteria group bacterium]|nr:glycosyltransferase family 39 protein [Patescibacteria group bacterium]